MMKKWELSVKLGVNLHIKLQFFSFQTIKFCKKKISFPHEDPNFPRRLERRLALSHGE